MSNSKRGSTRSLNIERPYSKRRTCILIQDQQGIINVRKSQTIICDKNQVNPIQKNKLNVKQIFSWYVIHGKSQKIITSLRKASSFSAAVESFHILITASPPPVASISVFFPIAKAHTCNSQLNSKRRKTNLADKDMQRITGRMGKIAVYYFQTVHR